MNILDRHLDFTLPLGMIKPGQLPQEEQKDFFYLSFFLCRARIGSPQMTVDQQRCRRRKAGCRRTRAPDVVALKTDCGSNSQRLQLGRSLDAPLIPCFIYLFIYLFFKDKINKVK